MRIRMVLVACALAGTMSGLGSTSASASGCCSCGCGTFYGLGYVPYYRYYPGRNFYRPCCGGSCYRRRACDCRGYDHSWLWRALQHW